MNDKHDITVTMTAEITVILTANDVRDTDKNIEIGYTNPDYLALLAKSMKNDLDVDHVLLRDLKLFIHDGNSVKEVAP